MNKKSLQKLEYNKIIELLISGASSPSGKRLCESLTPSINISEIETLQLQTKSAFDRLIKNGRISFSGSYSMEMSMKRLEIGGALSSLELLNISKQLDTANRVKSYGKQDNSEVSEDCLGIYFNQLDPVKSLSSEIHRCIIAEDEFSDNASTNLRNIRRQMGGINAKVHATLNNLLNGSLKMYLQDSLITMRGDRYCVPIKAEHRSHVDGMIHDQSSTGSTLFIEPMAVVKLNNEFKELLAKEQEEIQVILANLSIEAASYISEIRINYDCLTQLDFIFARGNLAMSMNASKPVFNAEGRIHIKEGRHPLLDPKTVVPITLTLGDSFDLLIVTGPNTGGKTVSIKTVGLFTLMGQSGLHIPANDRSELSVFSNVLADIGDEQSIEQSLSTFSSHMTNIVSFIKNVTQDSLVLFDELGAGTDPTEGAALAIAILSHLHSRGIRTMATTHYSELKVYALTTPGVENASCEFDVASLRPTYRLLIGVPGKSNAFAISTKLGLPNFIIEDAKVHLSAQDQSLEDVLTDLEISRRKLDDDQKQIASYKEQIEKLKNTQKSKEAKTEEMRQRILDKANEEANLLLQEAKNMADSTMKNFRKFGDKHISSADMDRERERLRDNIKKTQTKGTIGVKKSEGLKIHSANDFKLGDSVKVLSLNLNGTVSSLPDSKGNLFVQMGIMRSQSHISDLQILQETVVASKPIAKNSSSKSRMQRAMTVSSEINLLGCTVDEGISKAEKFLDDAYLSHLSPVRVVHGKGTGALRKGIHQYLKRLKYVESFRLGEFGEGDAGVTVVYFK